jgi:hypothetical protein
MASVSSIPYSGGSRHYAATYLGLPAKLCGIPNFMQYRIGPGAELQCAALSYADLRWSNLRAANLKGAKFCGSILWGSTLTNADLSDADLSYADFTGADLVGTNLSNATIEGTCFLGARYSKTTCFPKEFGDPESKGLISLDESLQIA